jgi:hypothetical protein
MSDQPSFGRPWRRCGPAVGNPRSPMPNSVVSIDSYFSSDDSDDEEYRLAQQEWEESLEQLAQIASVVLLPFLGRWLGRRWSYWGMFMILSPHSISLALHDAPQPMHATFASAWGDHSFLEKDSQHRNTSPSSASILNNATLLLSLISV